MDEELNKILSNEELDSNARVEAIKALVGKDFVPVSKHTEKIGELQKVQNDFENYKKSKMTDEEKNAEAIRVAQENEQKTNRMLSQLFAENVFAKAGIKEEDYKDIIPDIIQSDAETTKKIAEKICSTMVKQKAEIEKNMQKKIADAQKKPEGGEGNQSDDKNTLDNYRKLLDDAIKTNDFAKQAYYTRLICEANQTK